MWWLWAEHQCGSSGANRVVTTDADKRALTKEGLKLAACVLQ